jgi:hypothetical protein
MQCPNCRFENPEDIKFCGECGTRLERSCPHCSSLNPPNFKFCGQCGRNFIDSAKSHSRSFSLEEKLDKIQRYLPKGLTEKILAERPHRR